MCSFLRERAQRLQVKASLLIFDLHDELYHAKNSMTQFCLLLLLVAVFHCPMPRHCTVRSVTVNFRIAICFAAVRSVCVYYVQISFATQVVQNTTVLSPV